jgi:hypothetical protein
MSLPGDAAEGPGPLAIQRTEIDGVPVFHLPEARRSTVALQFRVGRSDEPFPRMGVTHVVEHLAMFRLRPHPYRANAFVDNIRTVFHADGTPEELRAFVQGIVGALGDLPLDRLADETRILRTEAMQRTSSIWDLLAWYRYGSVGPGALALAEYGLNGLPADTVVGWARDWFTRGNAALWIAGPMPADLRIPLPDGPRRSIPPATPIPGLPLPAWTPGNVPGIALGLHTPRTFEATVGLRILTKRLETHLRYDLGRSYEVSLAYQSLDAEEALSSLFASCLEADAAKVSAAFLATVEAFAASGPTDDELAEDRAAFERAFSDPDEGYGELDRAVSCELTGKPFDSVADMRAGLAAVTIDTVRDAIRRTLDSAILTGHVDGDAVSTTIPSRSA